MNVSQKCQYALRGVFELAKHYGQGPMKIAVIAERQAIPAKFLELILGELKHAGIVESRRGAHGGYLLSTLPELVSVGMIISQIDGPVSPVGCIADKEKSCCPLFGSCSFMSMWKRAQDAVSEVYDNTSFQDMLDEEQANMQKFTPNYCI